ncbi:craniofacial development protein 1-like [Helianthus annuus]|uniref:craniofacial development protein 1-like n=1 Tax=Helianthus annuus TaxID=4232 RepID=UPI0016531155|nr:craniofacial development protein 1-like [Helianthus annuus]
MNKGISTDKLNSILKKSTTNPKTKSSKPSSKSSSSFLDSVQRRVHPPNRYLSVLDKTKKDWGEFKEENRLDEELETYKKSGNQYLDKVSFLERADYRQFERERDVRLAAQAKRKSDLREDDD